MSEEDLELLITLDDPEGAPEENTLNHLPAEDTLDPDVCLNHLAFVSLLIRRLEDSGFV